MLGHRPYDLGRAKISLERSTNIHKKLFESARGSGSLRRFSRSSKDFRIDVRPPVGLIVVCSARSTPPCPHRLAQQAPRRSQASSYSRASSQVALERRQRPRNARFSFAPHTWVGTVASPFDATRRRRRYPLGAPHGREHAVVCLLHEHERAGFKRSLGYANIL
jgi:hypothetical protein